MSRIVSGTRILARNFGTCLSFRNSTTNQVLIKSSYLLAGQTNFTISSWFRGNGSTNRAVYCERAGSGNDILKFEIQATSGKMILVYRDDAGTLDQILSTSVYNDRVWCHAVITKTGTAIAFYKNGIADGTGTLTASNTFTNSSPSCLIGKDTTGTSETFDGLVDEITLYTTALTAQQVASIYYNGIYPAGAVGQYLFDEGSGTTAIDSSGTGNNGVITSATYSSDVAMKLRTTAGTRTVAGTRSVA